MQEIQAQPEALSPLTALLAASLPVPALMAEDTKDAEKPPRARGKEIRQIHWLENKNWLYILRLGAPPSAQGQGSRAFPQKWLGLWAPTPEDRPEGRWPGSWEGDAQVQVTASPW